MPIVYSISPRYTQQVNQPVGFFVATSGSSSNDGSIGNPWDLAYALNGAGGAIVPGSNVYLRGGTYFSSTPWATGAGLVGSNPFGSRSPAGKIQFKPYPGERAIISDRMIIDNGHDVIFNDLEVINTTTSSTDKMGIDVHAPRTGLNRIRSQDHSGNGIGMWIESQDSWAEECRCLNSGFTGSSPGVSYGHGFYSQNQAPYTRLIRSLCCFNNFGYGLHVYTETSGNLTNFDLQGIFNTYNGLKNGYDFQIGGAAALTNLIARDLWGDRASTCARIGYQDVSASADIQNCMFAGQVYLWNMGGCVLTWENNDVAFSDPDERVLYVIDDAASPSYPWSTGNNRYGKSVAGFGPFSIQRAGSSADYDFTGYKSQVGGEAGSTFSAVSNFGTRIKAQKNLFDGLSATVAIFNPSSAASISVDLSAVLNIGDTYKIYHDYNWTTLVLSGTYAGGSIAFPMTGYTPPPLLGGTLRSVSAFNNSQRFSTFLIRINS